MRTPFIIIIFLTFQLTALGQAPRMASDSARLNLLLKTSHADSARNNYTAALKHLHQYEQLKDSILEVAKQQQSANLNRKYQTAKKDLEIRSGEKNINLLTNQNRLMNNNLQQVRSIRGIIIAVTIVAALLLILTYFQYRIKQRTNLRLQLQEKAISQKNDLLQHMAAQKDTLLEEKELLIKEIHHRVKNNLQVVISLLNTQSAYLNDAQASAAIRQSQHRMQSISLIHQKLYQSESRALINMKEYTQELVQYLQQSFDTANRIAFKLDIADIELDVLRAVPIGLILNEAITNAIKYAFPNDGWGNIEVTLSCTAGQQLQLSVSDDGQGLPPGFNIDLCRSLGINLMKGMCKQISGQLGINHQHGVSVTIAFPMDGVVNDDTPNDEITSFGDANKLPTELTINTSNS